MPVTQDLNNSWEEKEQREAVFTARAYLEDVTNVVTEVDAKIQEVIDSGHFDTIPQGLKDVLSRWYNRFKVLKAALEADAEIMEVLRWRP